MPYFNLITIVTGVSAGLCVLAFPLWILGVPGTENDYAKGWKMGFAVIMTYPVAWLCNYLPYFLLRNMVGEAAQMRWQIVTGSLAVLFFLIALGRLIQAFRTMT